MRRGTTTPCSRQTQGAGPSAPLPCRAVPSARVPRHFGGDYSRAVAVAKQGWATRLVQSELNSKKIFH